MERAPADLDDDDADDRAEEPGDASGAPRWRTATSAADIPPEHRSRLERALARWAAGSDLDELNHELLAAPPEAGGDGQPAVDLVDAFLVEGCTVQIGPGRVALRGPGIPEAVGRWRIVCRLGAGGMGEVFLGWRPGVARDVAVKCVARARLSDARVATRFRREAKALARMRHPNIVPLLGVDLDGEVPHLAMEYVAGPTLAARLRSPLPVGEAVALVRKLARAVHHMHEAGIIHRDLKPTNVLLDWRGEPYLTDFGLARLPDSSVTLTRSDDVLGSPLYLPPEALDSSEPRGVSADVFSLGVVLYEALAGMHPFEGGPGSSLRLILEGKPFPLRKAAPHVPRSLARICERALQAEPDRRQASAGALADELEAWQASPRKEPWRPSRRAVVAGAGALLVLSSAPAWWLASRRTSPEAPANEPVPETAEPIAWTRAAVANPPPDGTWFVGRESSGERAALLASTGPDGETEIWVVEPHEREAAWRKVRPPGIRVDDAIVQLATGERKFMLLSDRDRPARTFDPRSGEVTEVPCVEPTIAPLLGAAFDRRLDRIVAVRWQLGELLALRYASTGAGWEGAIDSQAHRIGAIDPLDFAHDAAGGRSWFAYRPIGGMAITILSAAWSPGESVQWSLLDAHGAPIEGRHLRLVARGGVLVVLSFHPGEVAIVAGRPERGRVEFVPLPRPPGLIRGTIVGDGSRVLVIGSEGPEAPVEVWALEWSAIEAILEGH